MKVTPEQKAAIKAANAILKAAGLPAYKAKQFPTIGQPGAGERTVDIADFVRVSPSPLPSQWEVNGGTSKHHRRIGRYVGVVELVNSRACSVLLEFPEGDIQSFHPQDMFPWTGAQVVFDKPAS
ncbi:hypothetical protein ACRCPS_17425 [Pseudomonas aeruginosa]